MAISSGRNKIKELNAMEQFFEVGDIFSYNPHSPLLGEQDFVYEVMPSPSNIKGLWDDCSNCGFSKFCGSKDGIVPACASTIRKDGVSVYFKEL